ncbi:MAG: hypothetical protein V8R15_01070 [Bacilli bacterium]
MIAIARTIIIPIMTLLFLIVLQMVNIINFDEYTIMIMVIGFGAPLSAVVSTYCSKFNNEMELSSRVCFINPFINFNFSNFIYNCQSSSIVTNFLK